MQETPLRGVKYIAMHEDSGYGVAARRALLALHHAGVPVTWMPMVRGNAWRLGYQPYRGSDIGDGALRPLCNAAIPYDVVVAHTVPEYYPRLKAEHPGIPLVGVTVWETTRVPRHWPALLRHADHLVVPTEWNRAVILNESGMPPVDVVPYLPEVAASASAAVPRFTHDTVHADDYVFYTIGMWSERKGVALTIEAFLRAFTATEPVVLVVKTTTHDMSSGVRGYLRTSTQRRLAALIERVARTTGRSRRTLPRVVLLTEPMSVLEVQALEARGSCYVSLCRSEGWGMGAFDAAVRGTPVIMTDFGGQRDFLPLDHAGLVNYTLVPVVEPARRREYSPDQQWAEPDLAHGAQRMRAAFEYPDVARAQGAQLGAYVRGRFATSATTDHFANVLQHTVAMAASHGTRRS